MGPQFYFLISRAERTVDKGLLVESVFTRLSEVKLWDV